MANSDKNLVITPNVGSSASEPTITFSGADTSLGAQSMQARIYPTSNGTLSFEGSAGQLFSITNSLTGTIYSVNDVSGLPSIEVFDSGVVRLARYSGRVIVGNIADNGVDTLQFATSGSINLPNINSTGNLSALQYTSTVATGTAPLTVTSTTLVSNLNADKVDGVDIGTLTAAGGIAYATSTTALAATAAGTSGQAVISGGAGVPTFQTVTSANGALTIVSRNSNGDFAGRTITATTFSGSGASLTSIPNSATTATSANGASTIVARDVNGDINARQIGISAADTATAASHYMVETATDSIIRPKTLANAQAEIVTAASVNAIAIISGSATQSVVRYGGTTATAGQFDGSATTPTGTTRLNYGGYFYPTQLNILGTLDTVGAASHYFVETSSDGTVRPKTLANAQAEIVTAATVYTVGVTSGTTTQSFVAYNSTTATAGRFDGGATNPSGTTRLNYGGYLYATRYYTAGIYDVTGAAGTPTIYPDVTTGSVTIANGLTTGTLNLGATGVGAKTVNIGTSTGTTIVYGSTVRLPNAGTPGAGKYLQSDGSGNATWQTISGGASITNDTTTASDAYYPAMAKITTGSWATAYVSSTKLYYNPSTGQLNATNFNSLSDETKKENIVQLENSLSTTMLLRGVRFNWKENGSASIGVIAQEVEAVVPEVVATSDLGVKSVNYGALVGLLIEAIKDLQIEVKSLKQKIGE